MSANQYPLLIEARTALATGQTNHARQLLVQAIKAYPNDHRPWLWLAGIAPSPRESLACVKRAAALNPHDPMVEKARRWAEKQLIVDDTPVAVRPPRAPLLNSQQMAQIEANEPEEDLQPLRPEVESPAVVNTVVTSVEDLRNDSVDVAYEAPEQSSRRPWPAIGITALLVLIIAASAAAWLGRDWLFGPTAEATVSEDIAAIVEEPAGQTDTVDTTTSNDESDTAAVEETEAVEIEAAAPQPSPIPTEQAVRFIAKDAVERDDEEPLPMWTATPLPSPTPIPEPTIAPTFISQVNSNVVIPLGIKPNERWIDINLSTQSLHAYEGSALVFSTKISSGLPATPTVTGQFRTYLKYESQTMDGRQLGYDYYLENVPYVMYFYEDYAIHGTFWHDNFGQPMSHGCVNMETSEAQWIFQWAGLGTLVNVHY